MMRGNVSKPRSDPTLNLHDSGVAVDQAGAGSNGAIIVHSIGGRRYRKRRDHNRRRFLPLATASQSASASSSDLSDGGGGGGGGGRSSDSGGDKHGGSFGGGGRCDRCLQLFSVTDASPCLDFRWIASVSLACLAVCLCAGLLCLHLSASARLAALDGRCLSAGHRLSGLTEEMQSLHGQLAACRLNATGLAEASGRLRRSVRGLRLRVAELYAGRAGLTQVGPLREKVRKLVQDSADRGATIARLERSLRELQLLGARAEAPAALKSASQSPSKG